MTRREPTAESARWEVAEAGGTTRVTFRGRFDELTDFEPLRDRLRGRVELHLGAVTRINSTGVRSWVDFVHALPAVSELTLWDCPPAVVTQLNSIDNFRGPARVVSLLAPYSCESCGAEKLQPIDVTGRRSGDPLPRFHCAACGAPMVFEDLPERYLAFLK